jgi:DNA invertase Pin-like site-specific DNA recombinase
MTVAIYARKSTKQDRDDEDKSVATQIQNARAFAAGRGWAIDEAHVYADDAISGAETTRLVDRQRLLDVIESGNAPFTVLLMRDPSRFSRRDGDEAFGQLKAIARAGIEIYFYGDNSRFEYGTLASNVAGFLRSEIAADYRRQIAARTSETIYRKARAGHVTGGHIFGFDIVAVNTHKERRVNPAEAAIVVRACELYASGFGIRIDCRDA